MLKEPRVLYGLDECFVLLPYARGAKRGRLVLRARWLKDLCDVERTSKPQRIGAPLVLGELLSVRGVQAPRVARVLSGQHLHDLKSFGMVEWCLRHHRVSFNHDDELRFESGSRTIYATHTAYYAREELAALCVFRQPRRDPRARLP